MNADEQAIRALIGRWIDATREQDVEAVLALMSHDAVFLTPGAPPMQGKDAFARSMRGALGDNSFDAVSEIDEVVISGDMAYCRTRLSITITSKHGKLPMERSGHTLSILRKGADGQWLLTRDANMLASPS